MSVLKKLAGETAIYGISSILGRMLNILLVPLHTRVLTEGNYGVLSYLFTISSLVMVVLVFRMETAFFRFGTDATQRDRAYITALTSVIVTTLLCVGVAIAMANPIANWLGYPGHPNYVTWFALILGLDVLAEIPFARLRLEHRAKWFATVRLSNIFVNIAANLFFLLFCPHYAGTSGILGSIATWCYRPNWGVEYIILAILMSSATSLLMLLFGTFRRRHATETTVQKAQFDPVLWRSMLKYAAPLVVVGVAGMVNETMDRYLLMHWLPGTKTANEAQVGIYSGCYKLAMLVSLFTQAFRYSAEPFFFAQAENKNAPELYARVSRYFTLVGAAAFAVVMLGMPILRNFLDQKYWQGLHVVPFLLLANIMLGQYYNFSVWYRIKDKTAIGMWIAMAGAVITIVLNWCLIPTLGYFGSALTTLVCYTCMAVATWGIGQRYFPVPYQLGTMFGYLGTAVGAYLVSYFTMQTYQLTWWPWLLLNTSLLLLFFGAVLRFFERELYQKLLHKYV